MNVELRLHLRDAPTYADLVAREVWFSQAKFESPAMFRRKEGSGSPGTSRKEMNKPILIAAALVDVLELRELDESTERRQQT